MGLSTYELDGMVFLVTQISKIVSSVICLFVVKLLSQCLNS